MRNSRTRFLALPLTLGASLILAACAGMPVPNEAFGRADTAIARAQQAGAQQYAPLQLQSATTKIADARMASHNDDNGRALDLANQASSDADVATAQAGAAKAQSQRAQTQQTIDALRQEAQRNASQPMMPPPMPAPMR